MDRKILERIHVGGDVKKGLVQRDQFILFPSLDQTKNPRIG